MLRGDGRIAAERIDSMNETLLADRLRELEARVDALEALHEPEEVPPIPEAPRLYREAMFLVVLLLLVPAQLLGWTRVAAWANRLGVWIGIRGLRIAARRGTPAQRAHAARVYGGSHV